MTEETKGRNSVIDGLRGIGAGMVLLLHLLTVFLVYGHLPDIMFFNQVVYVILKMGYLGVDLFMVVSGYLITTNLLRDKGEKGSIKKFYMRRFFEKIGPLHLLIMVLVFIPLTIYSLLTLDMYYYSLVANQSWFWLCGANILIALKGTCITTIGGIGLGHMWSLAVEEQFYAVWPWVVNYVRSQRFKQICYAMIWLAPLMRCYFLATSFEVGMEEFPKIGYDRAYVLPFCRMDAFALGALLAITKREGKTERLVPWAKLVVGCFGLAIAIHVADQGPRRDEFMTTWGFSLADMFFASLLVLLLTANPRSLVVRVASARLLRWCGIRCYGIYFWHHLINTALVALGAWHKIIYWGDTHFFIVWYPRLVFEKMIVDVGKVAELSRYFIVWTGEGTTQTIVLHSKTRYDILAAIAIILTFLIAHISFKYFEEPMLRGAAYKMWARFKNGITWIRRYTNPQSSSTNGKPPT